VIAVIRKKEVPADMNLSHFLSSPSLLLPNIAITLRNVTLSVQLLPLNSVLYPKIVIALGMHLQPCTLGYAYEQKCDDDFRLTANKLKPAEYTISHLQPPKLLNWNA